MHLEITLAFADICSNQERLVGRKGRRDLHEASRVGGKCLKCHKRGGTEKRGGDTKILKFHKIHRKVPVPESFF